LIARPVKLFVIGSGVFFLILVSVLDFKARLGALMRSSRVSDNDIETQPPILNQINT
jgi:hypothetical protein